MTFSKIISTRFAVLVAGCVMAACSADHMSGPDNPDVGEPTLAISIGLSGSTRADDPADPDFEPGAGYENYLDIAGDDYRIYFFDSDNKYLSTFNPIIKPEMNPNLDKINGVDTYFYDFMGAMPSSVGTHFKLVVLANWGTYPEEVEIPSDPSDPSDKSDPSDYKLVKGKSTIKDLTTHSSAQFDRLAAPAEGEEWLGPGRLMPFYGVREYNLRDMDEYKDLVGANGQLKKSAFINLQTEKYALPLIRAMAKIEVILDNPFASFAKVEMEKINRKGYCAPFSPAENWKFDYTDYFHGYDWDTDFFRGVHLVGVDDNIDAFMNSVDTLAFTRVNKYTVLEGGKSKPEKWVAYVPEYKNINVDNIGSEAYTYIKVVLANPDPDNIKDWYEGSYTKRIYFATNGSKEANENDVQAARNPDGTYTQGRFNIERNNIYRFTITNMSAQLNCRVDVQPYAEKKLVMDYGLMRDERGDLKVLPDADGNLPSFFTAYMDKNPGKWPKAENGTDLLELHSELDDYYAIVLGNDGNMQNAEVWLKDSEGCRVMTNFSDKADDSQECSTRKVIYFFGVSEIPYQKDKDGEKRLHHYPNHCSIVLDEEGKMVYKTGDNKTRNWVESWDEEKKECWIIFSEKDSDDGKKTVTIFEKIDESGNPTGIYSDPIEEDKPDTSK